MKYKTLFRTIVKLFGVYLCIQAGLAVAAYFASLGMREIFPAGNWRWPPVNRMIASSPIAAATIRGLVGLYLFFGGKWIADLAIPANRPYCHECGYDLTGASSGRCPECDTPFRRDDVHPPRDP